MQPTIVSVAFLCHQIYFKQDICLLSSMFKSLLSDVNKMPHRVIVYNFGLQNKRGNISLFFILHILFREDTFELKINSNL